MESFEDGALAERLQSEEIAAHLGGNRQRNHQIRNDFPKALEEQTKEKNEASKQKEQHRQRLRELENKDAEVAQELQLKDLLNSNSQRTNHSRPDTNRVLLTASDMRHRDYEVERDRVFAQRLQKLEAEHTKRMNAKPTVPQPQGSVNNGLQHSQPTFSNTNGLNNRDTPPLPVLGNGDVLPSDFCVQEGDLLVDNDERISQNRIPEDDVLPHVRGGIKYNDDQYLVKLARPAVVTSEPVYANNDPDPYAVSSKYPFANNIDDERSRGAVRKSRNLDVKYNDDIVEYGTSACIVDGAQGPEPVSGLLLDAAGLSQKDIALSKKAEEQLIMERRDAELAKRLQEDLSLESNWEHQHNLESKAAKEAEDFEYARALQEKEELKLRRAKERSKQRRKQREMQQQQSELAEPEIRKENEDSKNTREQDILHCRSDSRISKKSQQGSRDDLGTASSAGGHLTSNSAAEASDIIQSNLNASYDDSDSVASANQLMTASNRNAHRTSISPKEMKPPARRPYMNPGAIDSHQSEFAIINDGNAENVSGTENVLIEDEEDESESEPRYANVGPNGPLAGQLYYGGNNLSSNAKSKPLSNALKKDNTDEPIPPYMPMQQQSSKKSTSIEQRIKRKKEKEGCKQQ